MLLSFLYQTVQQGSEGLSASLPTTWLVIFADTVGSVTDRKFLCLLHRDTKQSETSESGVEQGLLHGHARRPVARAPKP